MIELRSATAADLPGLVDLLQAADMAYEDPPEAYMLAFAGNTVAGCGRMEDHGHIMMLRPLVVAGAYRGKGIGRLILEGILPVDKPTALAARGEAVAFYQSAGFAKTGWDIVPDLQRMECASCPRRAACEPQPMIYPPRGRKSQAQQKSVRNQ